MSASFFNIVPRDTSFMDDYSNAIQLRVVRGIDVDPLVDINVTDLSHGFQHFHNNSRNGIQFKIKVIIDKVDVLGEETIINLLDGYMKDMTPLNIETDAVDIPNGTYLITENPSRSQTFDTKTEWELTFTTYNSLTVYEFKNNNAGVKKALKKAKNHNKKVKNAKLRKCNYKTLVYSKKKKVVKCVQYMQEVLYNNKFLTKKQIDGWYGKETAAAVKKFQKSYNKKQLKTVKVNKTTKQSFNISADSPFIDPKYASIAKKTSKAKTVTDVVVTGNWANVLPENGKVGKATFKALCNS